MVETTRGPSNTPHLGVTYRALLYRQRGQIGEQWLAWTVFHLRGDDVTYFGIG